MCTDEVVKHPNHSAETLSQACPPAKPDEMARDSLELSSKCSRSYLELRGNFDDFIKVWRKGMECWARAIALWD